ncbi:MAG: hypothetical protein Fur0037_09080 [Planctomycetota bacterium]
MRDMVIESSIGTRTAGPAPSPSRISRRLKALAGGVAAGGDLVPRTAGLGALLTPSSDFVPKGSCREG